MLPVEELKLKDILAPMDANKDRMVIRRLNKAGYLDRKYNSAEISRMPALTLREQIIAALSRFRGDPWVKA